MKNDLTLLLHKTLVGLDAQQFNAFHLSALFERILTYKTIALNLLLDFTNGEIQKQRMILTIPCFYAVER